MSDNDEVEWTLGDVYAMGDDETRRRIDRRQQEYSDHLHHDIDQDDLKRARTGGHEVRVVDRHGRCEVQVAIYRSGPTYGVWRFTHSPEGHEVRIEHHVPTSYQRSGRFDTTEAHKGRTVRATDWQRDPEGYVGEIIGKKLAGEVAPLLRLPPTVAPDAVVG